MDFQQKGLMIMKRIEWIQKFLFTALIVVSSASYSTLYDRGNGMVYDSDQEITWLLDANYSMTSGYDADGLMDWDSAMLWASDLNYAGYDDWRLPALIDGGSLGCDHGYDDSDCGYNVDTSGSELAFLWYDILENIAAYDTDGNYPQAGWGLTNTGADGVDFFNIQDFYYWTGTAYGLDTGDAWYFGTYNGHQFPLLKSNEYYAWAMRDGDVAQVSAPATLLLMLFGLMSFMKNNSKTHVQRKE